MYGQAELQAFDGDLTVPTESILIKDGKESVVYVQKDALTFERRTVTVGSTWADASGSSPGWRQAIASSSRRAAARWLRRTVALTAKRASASDSQAAALRCDNGSTPATVGAIASHTSAEFYVRSLIEFCVRRRLPVIVVTLAIAAYGVKAYLDLPVEAYPDVTNVQVQVIAQLPGLAPEEIERQVTVPIERVLNGTPGHDLMRSESLFGLSLVTLDVRRRRGFVQVAGASSPSAWRGGSAAGHQRRSWRPRPRRSARSTSSASSATAIRSRETRSELEWTISRVLLQVPGVADVVTFGGYLKEMHVEVDPSRLLAHGLTLADVSDALGKSNRNVGGGFLQHGDQQLAIRGVGYVRRPAGRAGDRAQERRRHAGHASATSSRVVLSHTPRLGDVGYNLDGEVAEGFVLLRRGENPSVVLDGIHDEGRAS